MAKCLRLFLMRFLDDSVILMGATSYKAFDARARNKMHKRWGWKWWGKEKEYAIQIIGMKSLHPELLKEITVGKTELIELGLNGVHLCKLRSFYARDYADLETASLRKCKIWSP